MSWSQESDSPRVPELQQNLEVIKEIPFFEGFPSEVLKLLAYLSVRGEYEKGDIIFEKGDDLGVAYYILSGAASLHRHQESGDELLLRSYGEGDFIGGFSLLGPMQALFTLCADTELEVLLLTREQFSVVLEKHVDLGPLLRKAMLRELLRWEQAHIEELSDCCLQKVGVTLL